VSDPLEIGDYRIIQKIGSGGVGCVYKALDPEKKIVALKILTSGEPEHVQRIKREFLLLSSLDHPNIVRIHDFGYTPRGEPFFSMEFIEGEDFKTYFLKNDCQKLGPILSQICQTLEFLHTKEIIHGDIKPSNILITEDKDPKVKFTDFGFSEYEKAGDTLKWKGTIPYIAPEIIRGEEYNHQSDLYSLGVTLYEAVTKRLPFAEKDLINLARAHLDKEPELPEDLEIPEKLKEAIFKLLKKDQIDRYFCVEEVTADLKDFIDLPVNEDQVLLGRSLLFSTQFTGREKELSFLEDSYNQVLSEGLKVILLKGEFGIGKTRLMKEFKEMVQLDSGILVWKSCSDVREGFLKDIQNLLGDRYPLVLLIDDFQNVDSEGLDYFLDAVGKIKDKKVMICLVLENDLTASEKIKKASTMESEIESTLKPNLSKMVLEPLNLDETRRFLDSGFNWRNSKEIGELIYKRTGGNSFLILWTMTSLLEHGYLSRAKNLWCINAEGLNKIELPEPYSFGVNQKLSQLSSDSLNLLKAASVMGSESTFDLLTQVSGYENQKTEECLQEILKEKILKRKISSSEEKLVFVNDLIRDFIYSRIRKEEKKILHEVSGRILEGKYSDNPKQISDDLAYHFIEAENKESGLKYSFLAGEKAENENDHVKALRHYQNMLILCENESDYSFASKEEVLKRLASQYGNLGDFAKAIDCCSKALCLLKNKKEIEKTLDTYIQKGAFLSKKGDYDRAIELLNQGLSLAEGKQVTSKLSMFYLTLGWAYQMKSDCPQAISFVKKASKLSERYGDPKGLALASNGIGAIYWITGKHDKAIKFFNKALKIFEDLKDPSGLAKTYANLGLVYREKSKILEAIDCFETSLSYQKEVGNVRDSSILYNNLALAYFSRCDWDKSLTYQHKSLDLKKKIGDQKLIASSQNNLGLVYLRKGALNQATKHFQKSLALYRTLKDDHGIAFSYFNLSRVYILKEKWDQAKSYLSRSLKLKEKINDKIGGADILTLLGKISMETGDPIQAEKEFKKSLEIFDKKRCWVQGLVPPWKGCIAP